MSKNVEQVSSQQFDQHMHNLIEHRVAPSLAVTAVRGLSIVVADGYGHPTLGKQAGASAETVYLYGSMTKLFTATAVMQLRERVLVDLDRAVRDYVQDFPLRSASGRDITVRHLLSHSSGIANPLPIKWVHLADEPTITLDDLTRRLLTNYSHLTFEPGSRYAYSNLGYLVLGQVVERVSGESFPQYMQRQILDVLDMHRTGFSFAYLQDEDIATGYIRTFSLIGIMGRFMLDRRIFGDSSKGYTALRSFLIDGVSYGGLVGCVSDLGNLMQAYLQGGMFTPQRDDQGKEFTIVRPMPRRVGLGWHLNGSAETRHGYHLGDSGGFHTEVRLYPQLDYGIAVCGNVTSYNTAAVTKMIVTS
jgi:CubicO group peptidase (beta-lactamase class C family)